MKVVAILLLSLFTTSIYALDLPETKITTLIKKATDGYNAQLKGKQWKADLIGEIVYFKKGKNVLSLQVAEITTVYNYTLKVNGKIVYINMMDNKTKNMNLLRAAASFKTASFSEVLLNAILPKANASEDEELEDALSSAYGWLDRLKDFNFSDADYQKERVCKLNEKEKASYQPNTTRENLLSEIRSLIKMQNKYSKVMMSEFSSAGECFGERCRKGAELQTCIFELAERRKNEIEKSELVGFSCFARYENGATFINSEILTEPLVSIEQSYSKIEKTLIQKKRNQCGVKISDSERLACEKQMERKLASHRASCPFDAKMAGIQSKQRSWGASGGSGSMRGSR